MEAQRELFSNTKFIYGVSIMCYVRDATPIFMLHAHTHTHIHIYFIFLSSYFQSTFVNLL